MENGGVRVKRAEIDTRKPFGSVKEAVTLFGDKVLAGELIYTTNNLKQMPGGERREMMKGQEGQLKLGSVAAELEETKQSLEKAKEESMAMAHCLSSLQEELENTKKQLQLLKHRQFEEVQDVKVVEADSMEFQKKRYVTFANPPAAVSQVDIPPTAGVEKFERLSSLKREKKNKIKNTLIPLISAMFSKKKGN
ncbi:WEB family protein At1g75720-like [Cucurbita moschata]|uniref:WEB family protein At1g75720-like n=1 Tax=Cucurbita moschata TaxID=3662 RepID=A0A6J1FM16_CUCMO|nr:WEB family protein At1g75720-like [Cucurbita moschata]